jgi:hypothetical protein
MFEEDRIALTDANFCRPCEARPVTIDELAAAACVDPADVRVVLTWLDDGPVTDVDIPLSTAIAVHHVLNPDSERTILALYYKSGAIAAR